jgi:hypothetical protein
MTLKRMSCEKKMEKEKEKKRCDGQNYVIQFLKGQIQLTMYSLLKGVAILLPI